MSAAQWQPITISELENIIHDDLANCSVGERNAFTKHRVRFYQVPIHRLGKLESVYVVARFDDKVLYYEDVEEGFALSQLDESGAMAERECNQFELCHVLQPLAR
jgi:hypothetical protein